MAGVSIPDSFHCPHCIPYELASVCPSTEIPLSLTLFVVATHAVDLFILVLLLHEVSVRSIR